MLDREALLTILALGHTMLTRLACFPLTLVRRQGTLVGFLPSIARAFLCLRALLAPSMLTSLAVRLSLLLL